MTKKLLGIAVSLAFLFTVQGTFGQKRGSSTLDERKRAVEIATLLENDPLNKMPCIVNC